MQQSLVAALGLLADRLEGASADRTLSESREQLQKEDAQAIAIARGLINHLWEKGKSNGR